MKISSFLLICFAIFSFLQAQSSDYDLNKMLDKINTQSQRQQTLHKHLMNYKYKQFIHFIKYDGDGEIDEQSKREYNIYVKSDSLKKRELISALNYEDDAWTDVTADIKKESSEKHSESKSFSLSEMFSPENKQYYSFELLEKESIDSIETIKMEVTAKEEDEDRFQGILWFDSEKYNLIKAELMPSDMPTFVDQMKMNFKMQQIDSLFFPQKIEFEAAVDVLFFFSGKIHSEILFSDFEFNQEFDDSWFNKLDNAE